MNNDNYIIHLEKILSKHKINFERPYVNICDLSQTTID